MAMGGYSGYGIFLDGEAGLAHVVCYNLCCWRAVVAVLSAMRCLHAFLCLSVPGRVPLEASMPPPQRRKPPYLTITQPGAPVGGGGGGSAASNSAGIRHSTGPVDVLEVQRQINNLQVDTFI